MIDEAINMNQTSMFLIYYKLNKSINLSWKLNKNEKPIFIILLKVNNN